jgi:hypothetical protein
MSAVTFLLSRRNGSRGSLDRLHQFGSRQNLMRVGGTIDIERGVIQPRPLCRDAVRRRNPDVAETGACSASDVTVSELPPESGAR